MRVLLFANNRTGVAIARELREQGDEIAGLVLHPPSRRKYGPEILAAAGLSEEDVIDGSRLTDADVLNHIRDLRPEIGVSALFGYILRRSCLDCLPKGCINLHPALLPYNRGANPNVWSLIEGTPSGVTIHYIDEGVDTGDIIAQLEVSDDPTDTGASLYARLEQAMEDLFRVTWPLVRQGNVTRLAQASTPGTSHRLRDLERIDEINLDGTYKARDLLNLLRARTFPPYNGAYFLHQGRKIYLRLEAYYAPKDDS